MEADKYFRISNEVLAEVRAPADRPAFWRDYWKPSQLRLINKDSKCRLNPFESVFKKFLPRSEQILEAGCGYGQYVHGLQQLGYSIEGIDFDHETLGAIKHVNAELNIRQGDVRNLDLANSTIGAYISLGVIEHYWESGYQILNEAHRVLKPGGVLVLAVPHFNPCLQKFVGHNDKVKYLKTKPRNFYQFYFTKSALEKRVTQHGFRTIEHFHYGGIYGAKRSMPRFLRIYNRSFIFRVIVHRISVPQSCLKSFSHMIMVIAKKV